MQLYHVYVLLSETGEKYIGYSSNLRRRLEEHNAGENRSTRGRMWYLVYAESYLSKADAVRRERRLKDDGRARRQLYERIRDSILLQSTQK